MTDQSKAVRPRLQRLAGELLDAYRAGETGARGRVNIVWRDARAPDFLFGLQKAQHVIAKEHGFPCWGDMMRAVKE